MNDTSIDFAKKKDNNDPLSHFRKSFSFPKKEGSDEQVLYFAGHSLGLMPKNAQEYKSSSWQYLGFAIFSLVLSISLLLATLLRIE